jgi:hypothetical protein
MKKKLPSLKKTSFLQEELENIQDTSILDLPQKT